MLTERIGATLPAGPARACAPVACTLGADGYRERMAWIAELNRTALISDRLEGATLTLSYAADAAPRVEELVRRGRECCPFLSFEIAPGRDAVTLTVTTPDEAREAAETLFQQFRARQS